MTETTVKFVQAKWLEKLPPLRVPSCLGVLTASLALFSLPMALVAYQLRGLPGLQAAAVAAGICLVGGLLTLVIAGIGRPVPLQALVAGLIFNMALPFLGGLMLYRQGGVLAEGGVFGWTVVFFEFSLVVTTILSLCLLKTTRS